MKLILISGDGIGAGKTTLAHRLAGPNTYLWSLASALRQEMANNYPDDNWWDRSQVGKQKLITSPGPYHGKELREALIDHGEKMCQIWGNAYWAIRLQQGIRGHETETIIVDDLRKLAELEYLLSNYGKENITHLHVRWAGAIHEPQYDNQKLAERSDYIILRREDINNGKK